MIIMESYSRSGVHDFTMASRKAEEASKFSIFIFPPITKILLIMEFLFLKF
jgi:hypothetical protein